MKDFFELMNRVFGRPDPKGRKLTKLTDGLNINLVTPKHCIPEIVPMPPSSKPPKAKERISELETQVRELSEQSARQTDLLLKISQQLSQLTTAIHKTSEK